MSLDPISHAIVEQLNQVFPPLGDVTTEEALRLAAQMPVPDVAPLPVGRVEDRHAQGHDGHDIPVRIYSPQADGTNRPIVVYYHGGGWVFGDLDTQDQLARALATEVGAVVVSVNYRHAPFHRFPTAAEDAYSALRWVATHAADLGADAGSLAVAGDSAGGNLAAVVALMARDRGGPALRFQLLIYPVTDHSFETASYIENGATSEYFLTTKHMRWYWTEYLADDQDGDDPYASPLRAPDLRGLPAALVVTAEFDPLRDEGEAYGRRLRDAGVPVDVRRYPSTFHGFFSFPDVLPTGADANQHAFAALRTALRPRAANPVGR